MKKFAIFALILSAILLGSGQELAAAMVGFVGVVAIGLKLGSSFLAPNEGDERRALRASLTDGQGLIETDQFNLLLDSKKKSLRIIAPLMWVMRRAGSSFNANQEAVDLEFRLSDVQVTMSDHKEFRTKIYGTQAMGTTMGGQTVVVNVPGHSISLEEFSGRVYVEFDIDSPVDGKAKDGTVHSLKTYEPLSLEASKVFKAAWADVAPIIERERQKKSSKA
jgi:hypothetical protein